MSAEEARAVLLGLCFGGGLVIFIALLFIVILTRRASR